MVTGHGGKACDSPGSPVGAQVLDDSIEEAARIVAEHQMPSSG
jgi:hypothetical protein